MTYQISKYELKATEAATVTKTNWSYFALGGFADETSSVLARLANQVASNEQSSPKNQFI